MTISCNVDASFSVVADPSAMLFNTQTNNHEEADHVAPSTSIDPDIYPTVNTRGPYWSMKARTLTLQ